GRVDQRFHLHRASSVEPAGWRLYAADRASIPRCPSTTRGDPDPLATLRYQPRHLVILDRSFSRFFRERRWAGARFALAKPPRARYIHLDADHARSTRYHDRSRETEHDALCELRE